MARPASISSSALRGLSSAPFVLMMGRRPAFATPSDVLHHPGVEERFAHPAEGQPDRVVVGVEVARLELLELDERVAVLDGSPERGAEGPLVDEALMGGLVAGAERAFGVAPAGQFDVHDGLVQRELRRNRCGGEHLDHAASAGHRMGFAAVSMTSPGRLPGVCSIDGQFLDLVGGFGHPSTVGHVEDRHAVAGASRGVAPRAVHGVSGVERGVSGPERAVVGDREIAPVDRWPCPGRRVLRPAGRCNRWSRSGASRRRSAALRPPRAARRGSPSSGPRRPCPPRSRRSYRSAGRPGPGATLCRWRPAVSRTAGRTADGPAPPPTPPPPVGRAAVSTPRREAPGCARTA